MTSNTDSVDNRGYMDDAMFSRKPLEGIACASCEKNLINMSGLPAQYYNWKRLPITHDRVPMVTFTNFRSGKDSLECYKLWVSNK